MKKLLSKIVLGVVLGVIFYAGFTIWADVREVGSALSSYNYWTAATGLLLAALNYLVRFVRWHYYLGVLKVAVPWSESLLIFLSGFSLTVTPGKLGEAVKAFLLRESRGIPAIKTAPIVVAERLTDLIGLLGLTCVGVFSFDVDQRFVVAGVVLVAVALLFVTVESLAQLALGIAGRLPVVSRFSEKLKEAHASMSVMLKPKPLLAACALSLVSWLFECLAFWVIVHGFEGAAIGLRPATFIYAAMTIAGALLFLPGGLGVTEAGMLVLLGQLGTGVTRSVATAATFVTRLCTLWFAVAVGLAALMIFARQRKMQIDLPEASADSGP